MPESLPRSLHALLKPEQYFRSCDGGGPAWPAMTVAFWTTLLSLLAAGGVMWVIVNQIPPDATFETGNQVVSAREAAWRAARRMFGWTIPGAFFGWGLLVGAVHAGVLSGDPVGDVTDSTAIVSWAYTVLGIEGVLRGLVLFVAIRAGPPTTTLSALERQVSAAVNGPAWSLGLVLQFFGAAWLGYVLYCGLRYGQELEQERAGLLAGVTALLVLLFGIA